MRQRRCSGSGAALKRKRRAEGGAEAVAALAQGQVAGAALLQPFVVPTIV